MRGIDLFPLFLSLKVASIATLFSIILGLPLAYYLSRSNNQLADIFDTITTLPVVFPPTVLGYYLLIFIGRQSLIGKFLEEHFGITLVFTPAGAVIAALVVSVPFLTRYARSAFAEISPDVLDAARLLGRNEVHVFFLVVVPIAWRGVATGIIMAFARALGDFGATLMVSGDIPGYTRTMPLAVYDAMQAGDIDLANRLVIIMTVTAVMLLFLLNWLQNNAMKGRR